MAMLETSIRLPLEAVQQLRRLAALETLKLGNYVPPAKLIRAAVERYLKEMEEKSGLKAVADAQVFGHEVVPVSSS